MIRSIKKETKEKLELITFKGNMMWGLKELSIPLTVKSEFKG